MCILGNHYGTSGTISWLDGNFNGDGAVNVGDLGILGNEYGWEEGGGRIPESATLALLVVGSVMLHRRRWH